MVNFELFFFIECRSLYRTLKCEYVILKVINSLFIHSERLLSVYIWHSKLTQINFYCFCLRMLFCGRKRANMRRYVIKLFYRYLVEILSKSSRSTFDFLEGRFNCKFIYWGDCIKLSFQPLILIFVWIFLIMRQWSRRIVWLIFLRRLQYNILTTNLRKQGVTRL